MSDYAIISSIIYDDRIFQWNWFIATFSREFTRTLLRKFKKIWIATTTKEQILKVHDEWDSNSDNLLFKTYFFQFLSHWPYIIVYSKWKPLSQALTVLQEFQQNNLNKTNQKKQQIFYTIQINVFLCLNI